MDKIKICKKIKESIRRLILFDGKEIIGSGTGIIIKNTGVMLTANHVIANYSTSPGFKIIANGMGDFGQTEYKPLLHNVSFDINISGYAKPLGIDLALLEPIEKTKEVSFIELGDNVASEGEEVIMAGFPDEIKPPLNFNKMLNFDNPKLARQKSKIEDFFKYSMTLIMMKGGMIGSVQGVKLKSTNTNIPGFNKKGINADGAVYWIDNASTYGASGGPVVDSSGKLIGIISEKGMTGRGIGLETPSGSTMALSHKLIAWFLEK